LEGLDFTACTKQEESLFHTTWFSNEALIHLNGNENKQNIIFWANIPHISVMTEELWQITVLVAIASYNIAEPIFSVTYQFYHAIFCNNLMPQLIIT
jgi:hypothetical protein